MIFIYDHAVSRLCKFTFHADKPFFQIASPQISRGELVSSSAAVPAKSAWNNAHLEKTEKLPARVKARLVRGERKLSPAATAAWKNAHPAEGATVSAASAAALVNALLGKERDSPTSAGARSSDGSRGSDTSSIASDASSLAHHVSTVTVTADDGEWETVSGKKDRARLAAKARGDAEVHARRARGGRRAPDGSGGDIGRNERSTTRDASGSGGSDIRSGGGSAAASGENGSASSEERAAPAVPPKPPKGWAAILTGRASSAQLTPSEAAALAAEEAAKEAAALKEQRAKEEEAAAREAAAAEERRRARAAAAERRAAEAEAAAARAVAGAPASKSVTRSPEEKPTHPAVVAVAGSLPPSRANSPKPSGPWASVVLGAGAGDASSAADGWRSLVGGALDADAAPQVTVTLDGDAEWDHLGDGKAKNPAGLAGVAARGDGAFPAKAPKALSALETAPAMPIVRAAKKRQDTAPAPVTAVPSAPAPSASRPSWSGWAVKSPPPKVDLKAEMEAALVTRAASPAPEAGAGGKGDGSAPGSPAPAQRAEGDASCGVAAPPKKKAAKAKGATDSGPPPPAERLAKERAQTGAQTDVSRAERSRERGPLSPPPPPTSPPLTLPGASRFPPRPFAPPLPPLRAPAPAELQPRLDAAVDSGIPTEKAARRALAVRLGAEMLETAHVKPDSRAAAALVAERRAADALIRAVHAQAQALFPSAAAEVFGSFPTNAWVPGASNVDVALALPEAVVSTPRAKMEALEALAAALRQHSWAASVNVVHSALRPLIFVSTHTAHFHPGAPNASAAKPADGSAAASPPLPPGPPPPGAASGSPASGASGGSKSPPFDLGTPLEVHISVKDRHHKGAATVKFLRQAEADYPALSSVLCVQKAWLAKHGLRGVYKGGIGSYSLALLALHALQRKAHDDARAAEAADPGETSAAAPPKKEKDPTRDAEMLGSSLLHFLEFYGQQVDLTKAAVVAHPLRPTGKAAKKAAAAAAASPEWGVIPVRVPGGGPPIAAVGAGGLTVSDPTQPGHNAGGGCFGIAGVQASFREQLAALAALPEGSSLLGALVAPAALGRAFVV